MANILKKWIESDRRELRRINKIANKVESYAKQMSELTDEQLQAKTDEFRERYKKGESLDHMLPEAFAVSREGAKRVLGHHLIVFAHSHSLANIPNITIQIVANAQQNRQRNILALVELTHCTGRNADIRAQLNLGYISLNEHDPELFVTNLHDSTPCFFQKSRK